MTRRIKGMNRKTRYKFKKDLRSKGKISITRYLQQLDIGEKVALKIESAVQKGRCHPRFIGKTGIVKRKIGRCYEVTINDQGKDKLLIVHPIHIKRLEK